MSTTTVIVTKVDQQVKEAAQETASELGMSLSAIIRAYLKQLIRTKKVEFSIDEVPNAQTMKDLKESEEDVKAGRVTKFNSGEEMLDYLEKDDSHDKQSSL